MRRAASLALLIAAGGALAAPAPPAKPADGPFEIDFTPLYDLPEGDYNYRLTITVKTKAGKSHDVTLTGVAKPIPDDPSIPWVEITFLQGMSWKGSVDASGRKLILKEYKDSPVVSADVSLKGLDEKYKPTVRRLRN